MPKYQSFNELTQEKKEDVDYRRTYEDRGSDIAIIAPHGAGIEPGTAKIARAIADNNYSFYIFEGIQSTGNEDLHLESTSFDDPKCIDLLARSRVAIAIHGCFGHEEKVLVGGRNNTLRELIINTLNAAGFNAKRDHTSHRGILAANLCNRCSSGAGVQLEITDSLRRTLFRDLNRRGREYPTIRFSQFVARIRQVLDDLNH